MTQRGILVALAAVSVFFAVDCRKETTVPKELIGVWKSSAPKYARHPFEIKKDVLIFEHGQGYLDFAVYKIVNVNKVFEEGKTLYVISYVIPEALEYNFSLYYTPAEGGVIRFKHQKQIKWKREW